MNLPYLKATKNKKAKSIIAFRGINYGEDGTEGQMEESRNLFSGRFPFLSPREGRERGDKYENATAVWFKDGLLVVDGSNLIYNGEVVGAVSPGQKQFANINTKVVIMPDKVVFDTKTKELRGLGAEYTTVPGKAVFSNSNTESKLTTHIGSYVEGIAGSGNVGGNDTLGQKSPTFMIDKAPFTTIYESGKVNEETGSFAFGTALTGDSLQAQNVAVGNVFTEASLGADGAKRFGRITKVTKFANGGPCHVWNKYDIRYTPVPETEKTEEKFWQMGITEYEDIWDDPISTTRVYNRGTLYYGDIPELDSNGNVIGIVDKVKYEQMVDIDNAYHDLNVPAGKFIGGYDDANGKWLTSIFCSTGLQVRAYQFSYSVDYASGHVWHLDMYLYGYKAGASLSQGSTSNGIATGNAEDSYPSDGSADGYWYVYRGVYDALDYYGFDYDLIATRDAEGVSGFEAVNFRAGDTVEISGCTSLEQNNITATIREITEETENGVTQHSLVFDSNLFTAGTEDSAVTITRKVPNLSIICENQNRLFGAEGNTIYVSALGDPTNMYTYDGVDTDSYSVAVATEGHFTGCIGFGKSVLFFKEDCMHRLMGDYPSEYQLYDYKVPGVLEGSEESLWNLNEVVYYHGREGVYRYAGGAPELISENFALRRFDTAAAGAAGDRYYISMRDRVTGEWGLWVYDAQRGIWLQEDETQAVCFARDGGKLFYIDGADGTLVLVNPETSEEEIEWSATLCRMDEVYHNRKCYSRLLLRADLEDGAWMQVEISQDDGPFELVYTTHKDNKTAVIPIHPNRCDNFRIRLTGGGKVLVRRLVREFNLQSEY